MCAPFEVVLSEIYLLHSRSCRDDAIASMWPHTQSSKSNKFHRFLNFNTNAICSNHSTIISNSKLPIDPTNEQCPLSIGHTGALQPIFFSYFSVYVCFLLFFLTWTYVGCDGLLIVMASFEMIEGGFCFYTFSTYTFVCLVCLCALKEFPCQK